MEKVSYLNQPDCYRLTNGVIEAIVTTAIGPRIIRYGFTGEENILGEVPETIIKTAFGDWKPWGGHRLWTAPEANPRSYVPDNGAIEYELQGDSAIRLIQSTEAQTGIQKEITVSLEPAGASLIVQHKITNRNLWSIDVAPWALTIMNGGGRVILPQESYRSWDEYLLPARPLVLWHYTDLSDARWAIGKKYIQLKADENASAPQKLGLANKQGWAAYHLRGTLFVKRFPYQEGKVYPDYGSNNETYTAASFIELESLGPITRLEPGMAATHEERWSLHRDVSMDASEESIDAALRQAQVI